MSDVMQEVEMEVAMLRKNANQLREIISILISDGHAFRSFDQMEKSGETQSAQELKNNLTNLYDNVLTPIANVAEAFKESNSILENTVKELRKQVNTFRSMNGEPLIHEESSLN